MRRLPPWHPFAMLCTCAAVVYGWHYGIAWAIATAGIDSPAHISAITAIITMLALLILIVSTSR